MNILNLEKFQLTRNQMMFISGGEEGLPGGGDPHCKEQECKLNVSEKPCAEFDPQNGEWFCSDCCRN